MSKQSITSAGPLKGLRVLDLGTMIAGPMAGTLLADFGADVIKIELPGDGDALRHIGPFFEGESLHWNADARNKKSVTIDMRSPRGQALVRELARQADVVLENFRPGTMARWGLDYEALRAVNPRLIMLSISGFGQTGPYAPRAAYDRIAQAFGGLLYITGFPDRPPAKIGVSMADYQAALFGAFAVMMAAYHRDARGGTGQHIDLALYEVVLRFTDSLAPAYDKLGAVRERQGNVGRAGAPGDHFETADGRYLVLTISNTPMFARLCQAMGRAELAEDPRYATHDLRWQHVQELNAIVAAWVRGRPRAEITAALDAAALAYSIVYSIADIFEDPHIQARGNLETIPHPRLGDIKVPGVGPKLSATPAGPLRAAPTLGEHTDEVLRSWAGLSGPDIEELRRAQVI